MNDETNNVDESYEDTLGVTDEALEAAAGNPPARMTMYIFPVEIYC